ncbi:MAG: dephospho-CoA kinase [Actinomycetota bacterium]
MSGVGPVERVVGLTGGIGVGKSTVAAELARLGATIVDCDGLGRQVVEPDGRAYGPLVERFGREVLQPDGAVDRPALGAVVFADEAALADLNAITHPAIDVEIAAAVAAATTPTVVLDMAVLVETELGAGQYHEVLVVEAPIEVRLDRLKRDRGMPEEAAMARIASQADDEARRAVADHVIVNDGDRAELRDRVDRYWAVAGLR